MDEGTAAEKLFEATSESVKIENNKLVKVRCLKVTAAAVEKEDSSQFVHQFATWLTYERVKVCVKLTISVRDVIISSLFLMACKLSEIRRDHHHHLNFTLGEKLKTQPKPFFHRSKCVSSELPIWPTERAAQNWLLLAHSCLFIAQPRPF